MQSAILINLFSNIFIKKTNFAIYNICRDIFILSVQQDKFEDIHIYRANHLT